MSNQIKLAIFGVLFAGAAGYNIAYETPKETVTFTVTGKDVVVNGSGDDVSSTYLVYTDKQDGKEEVFSNEDAWLRGKFNSSDVQGHLKEGKTYTAEAIGFRFPFFSTYRNLTNVKDVTAPVSVPAAPDTVAL